MVQSRLGAAMDRRRAGKVVAEEHHACSFLWFDENSRHVVLGIAFMDNPC